MALRILRIAIALLILGIPYRTIAYVLPEDALGNDQFLLPPTHTEASGRVKAQQQRSAKRRDVEQQANYLDQHPEAPTEEENFQGLHNPTGGVLEGEDGEDISDAEARRAARLLDRIEQKQGDIYGSPGVLRGRAPMVGTGPASILLTLPLLVAAGWTWRMSRNTKGK